MFGIEEALQSIVLKWSTIIITGAAIWAIVMFLVSKATGSVKIGSFFAGGAVLMAFIWINREGHLINYLSNISY